MGARMRLPSYAVWETATFVLNVLAFVLIGLQLRPILAGMAQDKLFFSIGFALAVLCTCVVARLLWVMFYALVRFGPLARSGRFGALPGGDPPARTVVRASAVIGWSGMRGIVTLAAAFALPETFPHRDLIVLTAFIVGARHAGTAGPNAEAAAALGRSRRRRSRHPRDRPGSRRRSAGVARSAAGRRVDRRRGVAR